MQLLVEPCDMKHLSFCINNNIKNIILPLDKYSLRSSFQCSVNQIKEIVNQNKDINFTIKINAILFENDLHMIENILIFLNENKINNIIFQDLAIPQIIFEKNLKFDLHYNPETLVVSFGQIDFFDEVGFKTISLARELMFSEIKKICEYKKNIKLEIQGHGYGFIMHSRWSLISNFERYYNSVICDDKNKSIFIRENLRKYPNIIHQDAFGTFMLTGYCVYTIDMLNELNEIGIDFLKLDFFKFDSDYAIFVTKLYTEAIFNLEKKDKQTSLTKELLSNTDILYSHGFLKGAKEILDLQKKENNAK